MFLCVQCLSVVHFMGLMWELERCLGQASLWNWRYARPRCIGCLSTWCPFNAFWWRSVQSLCWAFYTFFYRLILFHMLVLNSHLWKMCFFYYYYLLMSHGHVMTSHQQHTFVNVQVHVPWVGDQWETTLEIDPSIKPWRIWKSIIRSLLLHIHSVLEAIFFLLPELATESFVLSRPLVFGETVAPKTCLCVSVS